MSEDGPTVGYFIQHVVRYFGRCRACEVPGQTCQELREAGQVCCSDCAADETVHVYEWAPDEQGPW